jgi:KaiC/GvpD/RAD55 family RecA-like ATPase
MAMQFLIDGVERFDERGVFVSLEEGKNHLITEMANYGWDLEKYEKKNQIALVDASPLRQISKENGDPQTPNGAPPPEKNIGIRGTEFSI